MALIPEVIDKIKEEIHDTFEAVHDKVKEVFGDLATDESPVILADIFHGTFIKAPATSYYTNTMMNFYAWVTYDINVNDNVATFKNRKYIGHSNETTWWTDEHIEEFKEGFYSANEYISKDDADGKIIVRISNDSVISEYYNSTWYNARIKAHWGNADSYYHQHTSSGLVFKNNQADYTIDANDIVTCNINRSLIETAEYLYGLKGYPIVGNCNDTTYINNFTTNQGAVNNYTHTYTTPQGKNINVYYGDNYVITHVENNEPVTYKDIENAFNIAVDQINEDNETDITVPEYRDFEPEPPDIDDDIEVEMELNDAAFGEGLSHYYVTTVDAPVLSDISEAMSSWNINNTGKDLYKNLLSCRITKVGPIPSSPSTFVIYGEELQYNGAPITITKVAGNPSMDLGEYEILPKFNDFRDYAPYTKIEMFIPYCGWVALPSHVMSSEDKPKIITGTLLCDIIAGTCKAVIKCNDTVVAEASGFTAVDVPFTGENVGMKMAGVASAITSYGKNAAGNIGSVIGAGGAASGAGSAAAAAAGAGAAGSLVSMFGSYAQLYSAFNANYTEICGKTGDGCNVAGLSDVYIKIQRPKTAGFPEPDYVPEHFGHTVGYLIMKKKTLSECTGFTVCDNVDTSGIAGATERERSLIKRYLETGVIINPIEP